MTLATECAAALLSFRYPSLLIKDFLNALTASVLDFFYFNSVKFTYIDDMNLIFLYQVTINLLFLDGKKNCRDFLLTI